MVGAVVFTTPGELDLQAITTFGANAKPNTKSPIGYFGTGLKYAVAVLLREKIPFHLFTAGKHYTFYLKEKKFRDKVLWKCMMKRRYLLGPWKYTELPFTVELGKNWVLWQVFRELESNTRDENGMTELVHDFDLEAFIRIGVQTNHTYLVVGPSRAFEEVYHSRDEVFLPEGLTERMNDSFVQIFGAPSKYLYYRGQRVLELPKPSHLTYNLLTTMTLTEDRTLSSQYMADYWITRTIAQCQDGALIKSVITADDEASYEGRLDFENVGVLPSDVFMNVVKSLKASTRDHGLRVLPRVDTYYARSYALYNPPSKGPTTAERLREWLTGGELVGYEGLSELLEEAATKLEANNID